MSDSHTEPGFGDISHEEVMALLFSQMVIQQANMAMMLLGKVPHPQTGKTMLDLEAARIFIDQLEMLEVKTKGNLSKEEQALLKQTLMSLQMAYVEATETPGQSKTGMAQATATAPSGSPAVTPGNNPVSGASASEEEAKKKFSKKY